MSGTVADLIASGHLRFEEKVQADLRDSQVLSILHVEVPPGVDEPAHTARHDPEAIHEYTTGRAVATPSAHQRQEPTP